MSFQRSFGATRVRSRPRQSLRQCLFVLRRSLHPQIRGCLAVQADTLTLAVESALASDIAELERLEQSGGLQDLTNADKLYRGEFLAGLRLSGEPFEDWVAAERERFSSARLRILTALAGLQAQARDFAGAVETARRLTALDPYGEQSNRLLMELLAASGRRGLALIEHARVVRMLRGASTRARCRHSRVGRKDKARSADEITGFRFRRARAPCGDTRSLISAG